MVVPIDAYSCIVLDTGSLLIEICVKNSTSATNRVWHIYTVSVVYVFSHLLSEFSGFRVLCNYLLISFLNCSAVVSIALVTLHVSLFFYSLWEKLVLVFGIFEVCLFICGMAFVCSVLLLTCSLLSQKAMLLQQSSWQNNVRMSNLVEQVRCLAVFCCCLASTIVYKLILIILH